MNGGFYRKAFSKAFYCGFDEQTINVLLPFISNKNLILRKLNILLHVFLYRVNNTRIFKFSHGYLKKYTIRERTLKLRLSDFNKIIYQANLSGDIKIRFKTVYFDDIMLIKAKMRHWSFLWEKGKLYHIDSGELAYFHFQLSKLSKRFKVKPLHHEAKLFYITKKGISQ